MKFRFFISNETDLTLPLGEQRISTSTKISNGVKISEMAGKYLKESLLFSWELLVKEF